MATVLRPDGACTDDRSMLRRCLLLLPLALTAGAAPASAQTTPTEIHVAPTGADTHPGTSAKPLRTLHAAFRRATGGQLVKVHSGDYPFARDMRVRRTPVRFVGVGPAPPRVKGLSISGGQRVSFDRFAFTDSVRIAGHHMLRERQPARDIKISNSDLTSLRGSHCAVIRSWVYGVELTGNKLHDCRTGISGPGNTARSFDISIIRNEITRTIADGMQFAHWHNVLISENNIHDIADPAGKIHNDAIQMMGDTSRVRIVRNRLVNSRGQLLIVQPNVGSNDGLHIESNLFDGSGAYAIWVGGANAMSLVGNTVWNARWGGMLLRPSTNKDGSKHYPDDTVLVNNVMQSIVQYQGARASTIVNNHVRCNDIQRRRGTQAGITCLPGDGTSSFMDAAAGDFRLAAYSPLRGTGQALGVVTYDLEGTQRREFQPSVGAFE